MKREGLLLLLLIVLFPFVQGATIRGSIYDLSLQRLENAVVEIDTTPVQRLVSESGYYTIEVPQGSYTIEAFHSTDSTISYTNESIEIIDDGLYVLDLFLYPTLESEEFDIDFQVPYEEEGGNILLLLVPLVFLMMVFLLIILRINTRIMKKELAAEIEVLSTDTAKIVEILKQNRGRMSQKDLRKRFAASESTISLMLTELEALGKIKKIKKGRSNVLILQKVGK